MDKKLSLLIHIYIYIYIYIEFQSMASASDDNSLSLYQNINHLSHLIKNKMRNPIARNKPRTK